MNYQKPPLFLIFFFYTTFCVQYLFAQDTVNTDSLKAELQKELHDTTRINVLLALSAHYINTAPDTALIYAEQALQLANTVNWQHGIGNAHHSIGHACYVQGNFAQCLHHWNKALEIRKQLADSPDKDIAMTDRNRVSASLGNIGNVYRNQGDYSKALSYFFQALEMDSVMGNKNGIAANLGNIGIVYDNQGDYPKALSYYFQALEMDSVTENKKEIAIKLGNIGSVYYNQGDYPKALSYYFRSLEMDSVMGFKSHIAANLGNIGIVYHEQGNYPKAISYYFQALEMDSVMGDKNGVAIDLGNIGALYTKIKQYDKAEQYLKRSLAISDSIGALFLTMSFEKSISELYAEMANDTPLNPLSRGDLWQKAYDHHLLHSDAKDTVFGEEKTKAIGRVEMKHEMEMAELERKRVESEKLKVESEKTARRNLLHYSLIFFIIAIVLILVLYSKRLMAKVPEKIFSIKINKVKTSFFLIFVFIFILFETLLLFADPYVTKYTGGAPAFMLLVNSFIACLVFPIHSIIETALAKKYLIKNDETKQSSHSSGMIMGLLTLVLLNSFISGENPKSQILNPKSKADSLETELSNSKTDTQKVTLLNALFLEYEFTDKEKAKEYLSRALNLSEKIDYKKGLAQTYTYFGYFAEDTGNYAQALIHYEKSLTISKESDDKKAIAAALGNIGVVYWNQSDYPQALSHYFQALEMDSMIGNKKGIARHIGNIGIVYHEQGDYPKAISCYFRSIEIDSLLGNKSDIARWIGNIGLVYWNQGDYPKALSYYFQALEMDSVMGNKRGIAIHLGNIGIVYRNQRDYLKALSYYFRSLEMDSVLGNKNGIAIDLGNIGNVYSDQATAMKHPDSAASREQLFHKALSYYFKALEMDSVMGNKIEITIWLGNIGLLYTKIKQYDKAELYLKRSLAISDSIGALHNTMDFEKSISKLYAEMANDTLLNPLSRGDLWQMAYDHHHLYRIAKDSVFGEEKSKAIGRVEMKHEIEMAEYLRKQEEEVRNRQQQEAIKKRDLLQYSAILIGFFVFFGVIMLVSRLLLPVWVIEFISFVPFLILFEFLLVLAEPYLDTYTGGAPLYQLLFNGILAGMLYPLQQFLETRMKRLFYRKKREKVVGNLKMR